MHKKNMYIKDNILRIAIWFFTFLTVGILLWILIFLMVKGISNLSLEFLTTPYNGEHSGILHMIINTIYIILLTLVIAVPVGIFSAIYLTEYAKPGKIVNVIRFSTETLSGIPSIIYGLFGFLFFNDILGFGYSLLSGALTLSIMILPIIIRTTEESIKAVPLSYREGSFALGASRLRTVFKIILPCAIPGILTSIILSMGRIVGETAALIFTSGIYARLAKNIYSSGRTLSLHMYLLANEGAPLEESFSTAAVLIIIIIIMNFAATVMAKKLNRNTIEK